MFRITLIANSILILLAFSRCGETTKSSAETSIEVLPEEIKTEAIKHFKNFQTITGIALDSVILNTSELKVEELLAFVADIEEPFPNAFFETEQWNMMYKTPKLFLDEYPILVFDSLQISFTPTSVDACTNCLKTKTTIRDTLNYFNARPFFAGEDPEYESWYEKQSIPCSFGQLIIETRAAHCYDTGSHTFTLTTKSGEVKTLEERQNLIFFEADVDKDTKTEGYLIVYGACSVWINIYRILDSEF